MIACLFFGKRWQFWVLVAVYQKTKNCPGHFENDQRQLYPWRWRGWHACATVALWMRCTLSNLTLAVPMLCRLTFVLVHSAVPLSTYPPISKRHYPEKWPMLCLNEGVYRWHGNLVTLCKLRSQPLTRFLVGFIAVAQQIIWDIQQHLGLIME